MTSTEYPSGATLLLPRVITRIDIQKAKQALDNTDGMWSSTRLEQLEDVFATAEEQLRARNERVLR